MFIAFGRLKQFLRVNPSLRRILGPFTHPDMPPYMNQEIKKTKSKNRKNQDAKVWAFPVELQIKRQVKRQLKVRFWWLLKIPKN